MAESGGEGGGFTLSAADIGATTGVVLVGEIVNTSRSNVELDKDNRGPTCLCVGESVGGMGQVRCAAAISVPSNVGVYRSLSSDMGE